MCSNFSRCWRYYPTAHDNHAAIFFFDIFCFLPNKKMPSCGRLDCQTTKSPITCGGCDLYTYCSLQCQKLDWKRHSVKCTQKGSGSKTWAERKKILDHHVFLSDKAAKGNGVRFSGDMVLAPLRAVYFAFVGR